MQLIKAVSNLKFILNYLTTSSYNLKCSGIIQKLVGFWGTEHLHLLELQHLYDYTLSNIILTSTQLP